MNHLPFPDATDRKLIADEAIRRALAACGAEALTIEIADEAVLHAYDVAREREFQWPGSSDDRCDQYVYDQVFDRGLGLPD